MILSSLSGYGQECQTIFNNVQPYLSIVRYGKQSKTMLFYVKL